MSNSQSQESFNLLGKLVSVIALLAVALYFTGWIYRWFYFGFFQVEVTTLNLPVESFYIAAFATLFGNPLAILRTSAAILVAIIGIIVTFKLITLLREFINQHLQKYLRNLSANQVSQLQFLASLVDELIIIFWILTILYFIAKWDGHADAWRDAVNETSTLPAITVAIKDENATLGRKLDTLLTNPSDVRIIGDRTRYDQLLGYELNDTTNSAEPRIWRLLIDLDGYFYIFPALANKKDRSRVPPVLTVYEGGNGDRLTILSHPKSP